MNHLLSLIVQDNPTHARWLNTLSMMENTAAKKIKKCEHPVLLVTYAIEVRADDLYPQYQQVVDAVKI